MTAIKKYSSAVAFRTSLEDRLNRFARERNEDIFRLRRKVSFDRLLAGLFISHYGKRFVLKGGYALELRFQSARTTKDIDISINNSDSQFGQDSNNLRELMQDVLSVDLQDFFVYRIGEAVLDLENAPYGGYRYPIDCLLAGRRFAQFNIDIAFGDVWYEKHSRLPVNNWLEFAGVETPKIFGISSEQQLAEKLHAYTLPRITENSRVKDLIDMLLIIDNEQIDFDRLKEIIVSTFNRRKTHQIPLDFPIPPITWENRFEKLAEECGIKFDIHLGFNKVHQFYINFCLLYM